jgi:transcription elongation factor Elf1
MSQSFIKNTEDFKCEHCGVEVKGNGYTNHCPACLWSKHVDINPGDRAALETCGGMMRPIRVELEKQEYIITHECVKCGHSKRNKMSLDDDFDVITQIAQTRGYGGE